MQREQLDELLAQAASLGAQSGWAILGSQAVHAVSAAPPAEVLISVECDLWLGEDAEARSRIEAQLGKSSAFAKATGVYADPLPPDLPTLPEGWQKRLVAYHLGKLSVPCLEIHDLIVSKLAAGRLKDYEFTAAVLTGKLARAEEVVRRIQTFREPHTQAVLLARLRIATEATDVRL
jgi:hypothetical protein